VVDFVEVVGAGDAGVDFEAEVDAGAVVDGAGDCDV